MKKIHIIILVVIAISIAAIIGTVADSSTYATFNVAVANEGDEYHVVGKYVKDRGGSKIVGDNHLKLDISQRDHSASAIAFGMAHFAEHVLSKGKPAMPFDICYNIDENEWQGNKSLQLHIKDIKIS